MSDARPIGVFDSGIGGLTVVRAIMDELPLEPVVYFGDHARFPYGPRPLDEIKGFAVQIARPPRLLHQKRCHGRGQVARMPARLLQASLAEQLLPRR